MRNTLFESLQAVQQYSDAELELFMSKVVKRSLAKGDDFLREGEVSKEIAFITKGLAMHYQVVEGIEIARDFATENNWVA